MDNRMDNQTRTMAGKTIVFELSETYFCGFFSVRSSFKLRFHLIGFANKTNLKPPCDKHLDSAAFLICEADRDWGYNCGWGIARILNAFHLFCL